MRQTPYNGSRAERMGFESRERAKDPKFFLFTYKIHMTDTQGCELEADFQREHTKASSLCLPKK